MGIRTEEILVSLKLDVEKTKTSLIQTRELIVTLNGTLATQRAELEKLEKEQGKSSDAYKKQDLEILDTTSAIKAAQKEQNSYQLALTKSAQSQLQNTDSLAQMRSALSLLTQVYGTRTDEEKKSDAQTIKMASNIRALSDELKKQESALGNNARNVGNYTESIKAALPESGRFFGLFSEAKERLQGFKDVLENLRVSVVGNTAATEAANAIALEQAAAQQAAAAAAVESAAAQKLAAASAEEMAAAEEASAAAAIQSAEAQKAYTVATEASAVATGTATKALNIFKIALISTGIGALIIAVGALIAYFTKTEEGMDKIERAAAAVGAVFKVLVDRASSLGKAIVEAFENPIDTLKALGKFIEENFVNRFKAIPIILSAIGDGFSALVHLDFGALKQSLKDVAEGFIQFSTGLDASQQDKVANAVKNLGTDMGRAATAASQLTGQMQELEDAEASYITTRAANEHKIADLRLKAKEADDPKEKARLLNEVLALQNAQVDKEVEFAKRRAAISQQQFELGKRTREEIVANNTLQAKADEVATEGIQKKIKYTKELNSALGKDDRQRIQDEKAAAAESEKIQQQLAKEKIALIKDAKARAIAEADEELRHNLASIKEGTDKQGQLEAQFIATNAATKKQIREKFDLEELKAALDLQEKRLNIEKGTTELLDKQAVKAAANNAERLAAQLKQTTDSFRLETEALGIAKDKELLDVTKTEEEKIAIKKFYDAKQLDILQTTTNTIAEIKKAAQQQEFADEVAFQQLREQSLLLGDKELANARLKVLEAQHKQETTLLTQKYTESGKITKKGLDALELSETKYRKDILKVTVNTEKEKLDVLSTSLGTAAGLFSKNTAAYKILATAEAIINTYKGATLALATYAPPYGAIAAATVIAAGLANVAKINSTETKQEGGFTGQGHPSQVSTRLGAKPYVYHASEYVVPAPVLATPLGASLVRTLETMRVSTSNTTFNREMSFAEGGQTPNFAFINQESSQPVVDQYFMENALIKAALLVPAPVVTVEDINAGQSRVSLSASRANI